MSFLKKVFKLSSESSEEKTAKKQDVNLSLDDSFVHYFLEKGGKFLYCTKKDEVTSHLKNIINRKKLVGSEVGRVGEHLGHVLWLHTHPFCQRAPHSRCWTRWTPWSVSSESVTCDAGSSSLEPMLDAERLSLSVSAACGLKRDAGSGVVGFVWHAGFAVGCTRVPTKPHHATTHRVLLRC